MIRLVVILAGCLLAAMAVRGTSVLHYTLEEAVEAADVVVRGEVTAREYGTLELAGGVEMPVVRYTLRVAHCYVGEEEGEDVVLLNPGGPIDGGAAYAGIPTGFPDYRVGEEALLLLERRGEARDDARYYVPVGLAQGRYVVTRTEGGGAFASRGPIAARLVDRRTGEELAEASAGIWTLEELEGAIREAATGLEREFRVEERE